LPLAGVAHQSVEAGAGGAGARDPVLVDAGDLQAALDGNLAQVVQLGLGMLIDARNSQVQGGQGVRHQGLLGKLYLHTYQKSEGPVRGIIVILAPLAVLLTRDARVLVLEMN